MRLFAVTLIALSALTLAGCSSTHRAAPVSSFDTSNWDLSPARGPHIRPDL